MEIVRASSVVALIPSGSASPTEFGSVSSARENIEDSESTSVSLDPSPWISGKISR